MPRRLVPSVTWPPHSPRASATRTSWCCPARTPWGARARSAAVGVSTRALATARRPLQPARRPGPARGSSRTLASVLTYSGALVPHPRPPVPHPRQGGDKLHKGGAQLPWRQARRPVLDRRLADLQQRLLQGGPRPPRATQSGRGREQPRALGRRGRRGANARRPVKQPRQATAQVGEEPAGVRQFSSPRTRAAALPSKTRRGCPPVCAAAPASFRMAGGEGQARR
jgi:hypothetical protein